MEIDKKETYYKVKKGTDINLAVHAISKAFYNSYDIAFFLSADTDYIKVYEILKSIGNSLSMTTKNGCEMPIVSGTRSICSSASRISSNLHLRQSLSSTIRFMTSYRHPSPMEA